MQNYIPTFSLNDFSNQHDIFYIETKADTKNMPLHLPYRTAYYGIGIVLKGNAILNVNLESYTIKQGSIITLSPEIIKQWTKRSTNLKTITIFFTRSFFNLYNQNQSALNNFDFFHSNAIHTTVLKNNTKQIVEQALFSIKEKLSSAHLYKNEIAASLLNVALYEYATIYEELTQPKKEHQNRSFQISNEFKKNVCQHYLNERKVKFYADLLFITPKHLSEIIKIENGKTAGEWIDDMVILEAKILLQNLNINIAQIAETLNFIDQSAFGKFFKNITNLSPAAYRKSLQK